MSRKKLVQLFTLILGALLVFCFCVLLGSGVYFLRALGKALYVEEEIAREISPDSKVGAVIIRGGGGAWDSFHYDVYIVPKDKPAPNRGEERLFAASRAEDLQIHWTSHRQLRIEYKRADIHHFSNYWLGPDNLRGPPPYNMLYEVRITEGPPLPPVSN